MRAVTVEKALVEEGNAKRTGQVMGRTRTNRLVYFDGHIEELRGKLVNVRIREANAYWVAGEIVS